MDGVDVRTDNRIFEPVRFAHEFARIDVDRNKRFRLIDHNVAARFQPYLRAQRLLDLKIQSILFEYRRVLQMQLDAVHKRRLELVDEIEDRREFGFIIQANGSVIRRQLVPQQTLHQVQIAMDERGCGLLLAFRADVRPQVPEKTNVLNKLILAASLGRRAHDKATRQTISVFVNDSLEPRAFFVGRNLARHTDMIDCRHINQVTSGKRNVRGNARPFLAERFFRNLNEDLLPFPEQFRNGRPGFWRISVCPMFLLLDRGRATSASASAPAGRTVGEMVIVGTIRHASARRPFISLLELFIFLGLLC